jgi:hypothetical protein
VLIVQDLKGTLVSHNQKTLSQTAHQWRLTTPKDTTKEWVMPSHRWALALAKLDCRKRAVNA